MGFATLFIALAILIRSLIAGNSYEIVLTSLVLLLMLALFIVGVWKSKKLKSMETGWKPPFPMTANSGEETLVSGFDARVPVFFRFHFMIRGRFFAVGNKTGCPVSLETSVARGETDAKVLIDFPVSGVFLGEGFCRLRDIFGFFSFHCGQSNEDRSAQKTVKVRSAPCFGKELRINAQSGAEDRRNKHSANEERYYMREYTPGDRFRDINWKSSGKFEDTLITRISPDNQEKVSRIEVYLRNYGSSNQVSLDALWLLDRAKARLSYFLRNLHENNASYVFDVHAAGGNWEIEDKEDMEAFLEELAGFSFLPPQNEPPLPQGAGEVYVFSTACDIGLRGFLIACSPRPVSLFLAQPVSGTERKTKTNTQLQTSPPVETETLRVSDFMAKGCVPDPRWFSRGRLKQIGAQANRTEMIYAETKL